MELAFIQWLRQQSCVVEQFEASRVPMGIGDDAALLQFAAGEQCVVTSDMLMDGAHFQLAQHPPARIGRKALAVNLSDLAAMAAEPVAAFVSLALPLRSAETLSRELFLGLIPLAAEFGVVIAGGDTNCWDGPLVISVTLIGTCQTGQALLRSGAIPGDALLVTGELGGSILGRHLDFVPRVREALALKAAQPLHAACDLSDGLALDLWRMTEASGCGAVIEEAAIPISPDAYEIAKQEGGARVSPLEHALTDGEDFELLVACSQESAASLLQSSPLTTRLTQIGYFVKTPGISVRDSQGKSKALEPRGYQHGAMAPKIEE